MKWIVITLLISSISIYASPQDRVLCGTIFTGPGCDNQSAANRVQRSSKIFSEDVFLLAVNDLKVDENHQLYGIQYKPTEKFNLGIFKNYILGDSLNIVAQLRF